MSTTPTPDPIASLPPPSTLGWPVPYSGRVLAGIARHVAPLTSKYMLVAHDVMAVFQGWPGLPCSEGGFVTARGIVAALGMDKDSATAIDRAWLVDNADFKRRAVGCPHVTGSAFLTDPAGVADDHRPEFARASLEFAYHAALLESGQLPFDPRDITPRDERVACWGRWADFLRARGCDPLRTPTLSFNPFHGGSP